MAQQQSNTFSFAPIGQFGTEFAIADGMLYIRTPLTGEGKPSASGKTKLLASTGGLVNIPSGDGRWMSLNVGYKS